MRTLTQKFICTETQSGMSLHVSRQYTTLTEALPADRTFVWRSARVDAHMDAQRTFPYKGFSALGALVGAISSVHAFMISKVFHLHKLLSAFGALVRLEALMSPFVLPQPIGNSKHPRASRIGAGVWFLASVDTSLRREVARLQLPLV